MKFSTLKKILLPSIFYILFLKQFYSYLGAPYIVAQNSVSYHQLARVDFITVALEILVLVFIFALVFLEWMRDLKYPPVFLFSTVILIIGVVFWTLHAILESGLVGMLYSSTSPLVYLTVLGVYVGMNRELYDLFLKHASVIGCISLGLSFVYYLSFMSEYPMGILDNSSVLVYYIQGVLLLAVYTLGKKKTNPFFVYTVILLAVIMGILFNSRSWIIQCVIWLVGYMLFSSKGNAFFKLLKLALVLAVSVGFVYLIATTFFPDFLKSLLEKISPEETRAYQYTDLFMQTDIFDFIFGNGHSFSYVSSLTGSTYAYIDNAYLLMLVRYGILIGISYPMIFFIPLFYSGFRKESVPVFMWLCALGGLSVFCATIIDIKSIALAIAAGRCLAIKMERRENRDSEVAPSQRKDVVLNDISSSEDKVETIKME